MTVSLLHIHICMKVLQTEVRGSDNKHHVHTTVEKTNLNNVTPQMPQRDPSRDS